MKKITNLHIGHCTSPHGIKGEFSFVLYNPESSALYNESIITLTPRNLTSSIPQDGQEFQIKTIQFGNKIIVKLFNVDDRTTVERMVPFDIYLKRELLPETEEDEYYVNDLLGLEVFDFNTKKALGRVMDFYENGAQIVLQIKTNTEIIEILFISQFVPLVEIEKNRMEIILPTVVE